MPSVYGTAKNPAEVPREPTEPSPYGNAKGHPARRPRRPGAETPHVAGPVLASSLNRGMVAGQPIPMATAYQTGFNNAGRTRSYGGSEVGSGGRPKTSSYGPTGIRKLIRVVNLRDIQSNK